MTRDDQLRDVDLAISEAYRGIAARLEARCLRQQTGEDEYEADRLILWRRQMNNQRRKEINKAVGLIEEAKAILGQAQEEEQEYYDNMPESFQNGEKGERASATADNLQSAVDSLEEALSAVEEATAG